MSFMVAPDGAPTSKSFAFFSSKSENPKGIKPGGVFVFYEQIVNYYFVR